MSHITIISSSVRTDRKSHWVALYMLQQVLLDKKNTAEILDLEKYNFPIFHERLKFQTEPSKKTLEFADKIKSADGVIIVTPEYNGGYPASLKNVIDLLNEEWLRKPVAISTVSDGSFGGTQVIISLQFSLWKLKVWTVPAHFPVPKVQEAFNEKGEAIDPEKTGKRAAKFLDELYWCIEAKKRMSINN